jgi:UDP-N-acetylmuramate dehydrogenase
MAVRQAVLTTRRAKSLVFDRTDPNTRNCGSFFVNPTVPKTHYLAIQSRHADIPGYPVGQDQVKIPAGWLIERAGFAKGEQHGNVGLSTKHTLCLVAHGAATAKELVAFARIVRDRVRTHFDVELVPEPVFVGIEW